MDSILLEEENLVAFHRAKLEEDMEAMRQEMALLQEVDKPGSNIDQYVEQMTALLEIKRQGIQELQVGSRGWGCILRNTAGALAAATTGGYAVDTRQAGHTPELLCDCVKCGPCS